MHARMGTLVLVAVAVAGGAVLRAQTTVQTKMGGGGSPHVRSEWTVDAARISIDYGRPFVKGRKIFGGLEPYGKVWRTGADEATTLNTDRDLVIGGVPVPAGTYTLYTWLDEKAWKLIVNRQTGQWGTEYDQARDLARIDMKTDKLAQPVEQLTISIDKQPTGGVLAIEWELTRSSVPLAVKR